MAPSSQKNTKSVVTMWRGPLHAYHDGLRAVITEAAASGSLSGPSVRGPGGTRITPSSHSLTEWWESGDGQAAVFAVATTSSVVEAPVGREGAGRDLGVHAWWDRRLT